MKRAESFIESFDDIIDAIQTVNDMRTTVTLDDDLLSQAREFTGIAENSALIRKALESLVEREAARRLARLGGTSPGLKATPRRRAEPADDSR